MGSGEGGLGRKCKRILNRPHWGSPEVPNSVPLTSCGGGAVIQSQVCLSNFKLLISLRIKDLAIVVCFGFKQRP